MEVWPQMLVSPTPAYMYTVQRARSLRADAKEGSPSPGLPDGQHQLPTFHYQETPSADAKHQRTRVPNQQWEGGRDVLWSTNLEKKG